MGLANIAFCGLPPSVLSIPLPEHRYDRGKMGTVEVGDRSGGSNTLPSELSSCSTFYAYKDYSEGVDLGI